MQAFLSLLMGYFFGCIHPAALVSKIKHVNLKEVGTKNLGTTNTALMLGKKAGYFVLILDMLKSFVSYKLAKLAFPHLAVAGLVAGLGAILGHCFPFYLHFQGGKGLASFGGLVLAHDPLQFLILLILGLVLAFALDYGVYLALSAALLFPVFSFLRSGSIDILLAAAAAGGLIVVMHWSNFRRARSGEDPVRMRSGLKTIFGK